MAIPWHSLGGDEEHETLNTAELLSFFGLYPSSLNVLV
jgi:hypothetical protein